MSTRDPWQAAEEVRGVDLERRWFTPLMASYVVLGAAVLATGQPCVGWAVAASLGIAGAVAVRTGTDAATRAWLVATWGVPIAYVVGAAVGLRLAVAGLVAFAVSRWPLRTTRGTDALLGAPSDDVALGGFAGMLLVGLSAILGRPEFGMVHHYRPALQVSHAVIQISTLVIAGAAALATRTRGAGTTSVVERLVAVALALLPALALLDAVVAGGTPAEVAATVLAWAVLGHAVWIGQREGLSVRMERPAPRVSFVLHATTVLALAGPPCVAASAIRRDASIAANRLVEGPPWLTLLFGAACLVLGVAGLVRRPGASASEEAVVPRLGEGVTAAEARVDSERATHARGGWDVP